MPEQKTKLSNAYKSEYLAADDVRDMVQKGKQVVTVSKVTQYTNKKIQGRTKPIANIATFTDASIKPWVLNSGCNTKLKRFAGNAVYVEDIVNITIELYVDETVKFCDNEGGVRIKPTQPNIILPTMTPDDPKWVEVQDKVQAKNMTRADFEKFYKISDEHWALLSGIEGGE